MDSENAFLVVDYQRDIKNYGLLYSQTMIAMNLYIFPRFHLNVLHQQNTGLIIEPTIGFCFRIYRCMIRFNPDVHVRVYWCQKKGLR